MGFVVDASVAAAWLLPDENNDLAEITLDALTDQDASAPDLLIHEIRNILLSAEKRKRIDGDLVVSLMNRFRHLPINYQKDSDDIETIRLARSYGLSAYDAAYLSLSLLSNLPLATNDTKLRNAAMSENIVLFG